jgi:hypothetical protein
MRPLVRRNGRPTRCREPCRASRFGGRPAAPVRRRERWRGDDGARLRMSIRSARRPGRTVASARSATRRSSRACGRKAWPSIVSCAPRADRVNSRTPRSFSSTAMRLETPCCVTDKETAASWNWPASARGNKGSHALEIHVAELYRDNCGLWRRPGWSCLIGPCVPCFDRRAQRQVVRSGRCEAWLADGRSAGNSDGCGRRTP